MPRPLAQQRMTLSDLGWPFHALRAISGVAELVIEGDRWMGIPQWCSCPLRKAPKSRSIHG